LALELQRGGHVQPAIFSASAEALPILTRASLAPLLEDTARHAAKVRDAGGGCVHFDGLVLRALGNNFEMDPVSERVIAPRNVGVIFFEDTMLDAAALARARAFDLVITGSHWNEQVLRERGLTNVATVLQGVDPSLFHPAPRAGHFGDRFVVFSGGKLEYRKGQDLVIAAFRAFRQRHPEALLVVAWHNNWPTLIADLDLAGHVRGTPTLRGHSLGLTEWLAANGIPADATIDVGQQPNALMGQVLRECDVALFPNRCEGGTNLVAMECMAAGVPTIVSANTGHLDLVATGGCLALERQRAARMPTRFFRGAEGWGESDVEEIVEALEFAYNERSAMATLARRGADAMAAQSWRHQTQQLLQTLQPLI
ncbi:MAG: glycosyltransferase family 4 protein, partial [Gemmatimonadaceae bacterium]